MLQDKSQDVRLKDFTSNCLFSLIKNYNQSIKILLVLQNYALLIVFICVFRISSHLPACRYKRKITHLSSTSIQSYSLKPAPTTASVFMADFVFYK